MWQYQDLIRTILNEGVKKEDRTGVGTVSVFGHHMRFNLQEGFPLVTTKKVPWKSVVSELLWFIEGSTDERRLAEILYGKPRDRLVGKRTIWTANADEQGKALGYQNDDVYKGLGPIYGNQWRFWDDGTDQLQTLIQDIKSNPDSRRLILTAWNVSELHKMALPPCHCFAQFYVSNNQLSCQMYQRSADVFLGVPFNIASYSLLTHMIAHVCGLDVGDFILTIGDAHVYNNHMDQVNILLEREPLPLPNVMLSPELAMTGRVDLFNMDDIKLLGYQHHTEIKAEMAV